MIYSLCDFKSAFVFMNAFSRRDPASFQLFTNLYEGGIAYGRQTEKLFSYDTGERGDTFRDTRKRGII